MGSDIKAKKVVVFGANRPQTGPSCRRGQQIGIRQSRFDPLRSLNDRRIGASCASKKIRPHQAKAKPPPCRS